MANLKEHKGKAFEEDSVVLIDTNIWMRPKTACEELRERGFDVSYSLMNYWKNNDKIRSKIIKSLDNLTLVNIETIPEEMRVRKKIT